MSAPVPKKYYDVENAPSQTEMSGYLAAAIDGATGEAFHTGISTLDILTKKVGIGTIASIPIEIKKDNDRWTVNVGETVITFFATAGPAQVATEVAIYVAALILGVESLPIVATVAIGAAVAVGVSVVWNKVLDLGGQDVIDAVLNSQTREIIYEQSGRPLNGVIYDELPTSEDVRDALIDMTNHSAAVPGGTLKLLTSGKFTEEYSIISAKAAADISASLGATTTEFQSWNWAKGADGTEASNNQLVIENNDLTAIIHETGLLGSIAWPARGKVAFWRTRPLAAECGGISG